MEGRSVLAKILAIMGTVLVGFPILAPIVVSIISVIVRGIFQFDYLMPAELGLFAFGGGVILLAAALLARSRVRLIGWGLGIAFVMVFGGQAIAVVTGLADGSTGIGGWQWALVVASLLLYMLAVVAVGVGGILLLRDLFKNQHPLTSAH